MSFIVFWLMDLSQQTCNILVFKSLLAESHVGLHIYSKTRHMTSAKVVVGANLCSGRDSRDISNRCDQIPLDRLAGQYVWDNFFWNSCPLFSPLILLLPARSASTWKQEGMFSSSQSFIIHKTLHECLSLFWQRMSAAPRSSCFFFISVLRCVTLCFLSITQHPRERKLRTGKGYCENSQPQKL